MILSYLPTLGFLALILPGALADRQHYSSTNSLFPVKADASHASPKAASFLEQQFIAKSKHDADAWVAFFNPNSTFSYDAVTGPAALNYTAWVKVAQTLTKRWGPDAISYPLRILGDIEQGAIVHFVDTPQILGDELRLLSAYDFLDGKITREIDYFDGRGTAIAKNRVSDDQYDKTLGISRVTEKASPVMQHVVHKLQGYLSAQDFNATSGLFSSEAVFEDYSLRTRQEGRLNIAGYLQRILPTAPYGKGATVRHVLGSNFGGGYEWIAASNPKLMVFNGITGLELDEHHLITRLTVLWDSSRVDSTTLALLTGAAVPTQT